jgi:hypothetical protein
MVVDPSNRVVTIHVNELGEFTYEPAVLRIQAGALVSWQCPDGKFVLSFGRQTPLEGVVEVASEHQGDFWRTPSLRIDPMRPVGVYSYSVAVANDDGIWLDAFCPSVIIRR